MCDIKLYNPGDVVDISNGGVIFKGKLARTSSKNLLSEKEEPKYTSSNKDDSARGLNELQDLSAQRMTEGMKVQKTALKKK